MLQAPKEKAWWLVSNSHAKLGFVPKSFLAGVHHAVDPGIVRALQTAILKRKTGKLSHEELQHILAVTKQAAAHVRQLHIILDHFSRAPPPPPPPHTHTHTRAA